MLTFAIIFALIWGGLWAAYLQFTQYGRYLVLRRTWITVVIGVGVDLLLSLLVIDLHTWLTFASIIVASSVGVITRSLYNEIKDDDAATEVNKDAGSQ